jgi:hypothetical protein
MKQGMPHTSQATYPTWWLLTEETSVDTALNRTAGNSINISAKHSLRDLSYNLDQMTGSLTWTTLHRVGLGTQQCTAMSWLNDMTRIFTQIDESSLGTAWLGCLDHSATDRGSKRHAYWNTVWQTLCKETSSETKIYKNISFSKHILKSNFCTQEMDWSTSE